MKPSFPITRDNQGWYSTRVLNTAGQLLLESWCFASKSGCEEGIKRIKENGLDDTRYERIDEATTHFFQLKTARGRLIGKSPLYNTAAERDNALEQVKTLIRSVHPETAT